MGIVPPSPTYGFERRGEQPRVKCSYCGTFIDDACPGQSRSCDTCGAAHETSAIRYERPLQKWTEFDDIPLPPNEFMFGRSPNARSACTFLACFITLSLVAWVLIELWKHEHPLR